MKKTAIVAAIVVVIAAAGGGGYYVAHRQATERMDAAIAEFRASLPPGSTLGYASATPRLFSRSGHFTDVSLVTGGKTFTAATLDVSTGDGRTLRHLEATNVTAKDPGVQMNLDRFDMDGLVIPGTATKIADIDPATVTFDHAAAHGFHTVPGRDGTVAVADMTVDGYGPGRPTTVDVSGVASDLKRTAVDHVSLDHLRLGGLLVADLVAWARTGTGPMPHSLQYAMDVGKLSVTAGGKPFVTLASLTTGSEPKGADQFESRFDVKDLVVMAMPGLTPGLTELGYDRFQGRMQMHAIADRAAQQMRMDRLDVDAPAMGRLHLALALDKVPYRELASASGQRSSLTFLSMLQAALSSAELTYEDHSLVGKALAAAAAQQHTTPEALKQGGVAALRATGAQLHLSPAVLDPIAAFINDPHRINIAVKPPQPIVLMTLSRVEADPEHALGLTVSN